MPVPEESSALLFAHRGGGGLWPENTMMAFEGAYALGVRFMETDLHLSRDGHLVVFHDESLERTTDGAGLVCDHTLAELRELDAAHYWPGVGRQPIPTLAELCQLGPIRINVDLKQLDPPIFAALWRFIDAHALHDRFVVASEHHENLVGFRRLSRGRVATSASKREVARFWAAARAGMTGLVSMHYDALQVPVAFAGLRVVTSRFVRAAHRCGVAVHVWTIDEPEQARALLGLGVDGIMTDRPDLMQAELHNEFSLQNEEAPGTRGHVNTRTL